MARWKARAIRWAAALGFAALAGNSGAQNDFVFKTTPLGTRRAFGGTAVLGDNIYYFSGGKAISDDLNTESPTNSVIRAKVYPDGKLGPWEETTPLPEPRFYIDASTLVLNDVVYIVGGSSLAADGTRYNTAVYTRPLPNGTLLPWAVSQPFGGAGGGLSTITAVSTPGHIHTIGGLRLGGQASNEVWTNAIYADGTLGPWIPGPPLPMPLWYHSAGAASGRVYVWGGMPVEDSSNVSGKVFSAPILGSGKLGSWREEPASLPRPFYAAASAVAGNFLLSFSPRYAGAQRSNEVWYSTVTPTGLSPWRTRQTVMPNKQYHAAAVDYRRGMIFFGGGRTELTGPMLQDFWFFQLGAQVRQSAEQSWLQHQRAHQNTVSAFLPPAPGQQQQAPTTLTYISAAKLSTSAVAGFKTYDEARAESAAQRKPLVVYFNLEGAQPCIEQRQQLASPEFAAALGAASWAWVETKDNPQLAQQLGVYRVPTWIFYDKAGNEVSAARSVGAKSAADIAKAVAALK